MHFSKMHAMGNDFMVLDGVTQKVILSPEKIRSWADRHRGIGFDQLLLLEPPYDPEIDFHYRIFNADGNEVSQCGNGGCCLAYFVKKHGLVQHNNIRITANSGPMELQIWRSGQVQLALGEPTFEPSKIPCNLLGPKESYEIHVEDKLVHCSVVSVGNPHCVVRVSDCYTAPVSQLGPLIASHQAFPEQTNVGFMEVINPMKILLRVYERGVGETLACGSGACSAVAVGISQGLLSESVEVELPGGSLNVRWQGVGNPIYLTGQPQHVFDGTIER